MPALVAGALAGCRGEVSFPMLAVEALSISVPVGLLVTAGVPVAAAYVLPAAIAAR